MMIIRQNEEVQSDKFLKVVEWLIENFDFDTDKMFFNSDEKLLLSKGHLLRARAYFGERVAEGSTGRIRINRTYHFANDEMGCSG